MSKMWTFKPTDGGGADLGGEILDESGKCVAFVGSSETARKIISRIGNLAELVAQLRFCVDREADRSLHLAKRDTQSAGHSVNWWERNDGCDNSRL